MPIIFSFLFLLGCMPPLYTKLPSPAYCIVPVADLLSERFSPTASRTAADFYAALPLSERQPVSFCCRITQLLFNERVTIIEQRNDQSFIEVPFWYLKTPSPKSPGSINDRFWTLTKNLRPLSVLSPEARATIPPTNLHASEGKIVTLTMPWFCKETKTTYSAGTRFMGQTHDTAGYHIILTNEGTSSDIITSVIPTQNAIPNKKRSLAEQRILFVTTLRTWAQGIPHKIPYVWGGASIIQTFTNPVFKEQSFAIGKKKGIFFTRPECATTPQTGVDCSGLIRLGCKIAGISLTATNSRSIVETLRQLSPTDTIREGDLIAWKGHLTVITDVKRGLMIEARGYEHFYGYVQEIPYEEQLQEIHTTEDLQRALLKKKPLKRLDKKGKQRELITDLKILSLFPA